MVSTRSLLPKLKADFPAIRFVAAPDFSWSPQKRTVFYVDGESDGDLLLHELSHGLLGHTVYGKDIELVAMETAAWDHAKELARRYGLELDEDAAEDNLDTYRDWMHARSSCPRCEASGYQTGRRLYDCVACGHRWRVNEARLCDLRRYSLTN